VINETLVTQGSSASGEPNLVAAFALPAIMTIETAETLAIEFKQLIFERDASLTLDASHVENITTPGMQLIASLKKSITAQGGTLIINGTRTPFVHALTDAGLKNLLG
jgi:anti-anti-sigma regulatory factor